MLTTNFLLVAVPGFKCTLQGRILLGWIVDRYCTYLSKLLSHPKVEPGGINQTISAGPCFILSCHISFDAKVIF
jgi:hypothetical protein